MLVSRIHTETLRRMGPWCSWPSAAGMQVRWPQRGCGRSIHPPVWDVTEAPVLLPGSAVQPLSRPPAAAHTRAPKSPPPPSLA